MDETGKMKILLADDNYLSREIAKCLSANDGTCTSTANGREALGKINEGILNKSYFDLIFLFDILKGMDGAETLKKIRTMEDEAGLSLSDSSVVVMITKHKGESFFLSTLYKDCDYFLQLPVDRLKLAIILETTKNDVGLKFLKSA